MPPRLVLNLYRLGFAIAFVLGLVLVDEDAAGAIIWFIVAAVFFALAYQREH